MPLEPTLDQTLASNARIVLARLNELAQAPSTPPQNVETAQQWHQALSKTLHFLEDLTHPVVFIGSVGVGKSSLISVLARLLVGPSPTDRASLKDNSVLAIGSGRTTVCEVRIQASPADARGLVGLIIEPFSLEEMKKEIEFYAQDEWTRRQPDVRRQAEDDAASTSQEVYRFIRGMTGYAEYQETFLEGGLRRRRNVRPLDDVVPRFSNPSQFAEHLLERANLLARTQTEWWWDAPSPEMLEQNLRELKAAFESVNQGSMPTAILPKRMTVVVPDSLPEIAPGLFITLIDTRGLDGKIEPRRDLQELMRDPRAIIVLCAPFRDAPGDSLRALLRSMAADAELRKAISNTLLVLIDQGDAEQVNGAEGDREFGQELKISECATALESAGSLPLLDRAQLLAFDALRDDRERLLEALDERLANLRKAREEELHEQIEDAQSFLASDDNQPALRAVVDKQLRDTLVQHLLSGTPLRDPLSGLYSAIRECRYASVVYATCRRNGNYPRLDVYAAVGAEATRAATAWLDDLINAATSRLDELSRDPTLQAAQAHIRLRRRQFVEGQLNVISGYAAQVAQQVEDMLRPDPIWQTCCEEWSRGTGFKDRVLEHLEGWARRQQGLSAHEHTAVESEIPLLAEVARPLQAPQFTLYVRNLHALRHVSWTPETVSALIGANGTGKTTLLLTLRLLRVAYERGLPEAVRIVLGGSSNLKFWGAPEDEPVELGLDIGEASWRFTLTPREGSADYLSEERFMDGQRELFSRDSLGNFSYGGERLEPSPHLGLRVLMDRGAHEPSLRRVASFVQDISVYHDPDLWTLRVQGSSTTEDRHLHFRGANALTMLRRWYQERDNRHRYQFVIEGLSAALPNSVSELDFVAAGNTLVARIYKPGRELPSPLNSEANGVLQMLVLLCNVAAAERGSVVAIDEPENSLHPYALRRFLDRTRRWARQHDLTVLLATHSTVILDELSAHPEQVYVMMAPAEAAPMPTRLDMLCDREWLTGFKLGDLYEQGELGSNEDKA
jgi:predicted ATPase